MGSRQRPADGISPQACVLSVDTVTDADMCSEVASTAAGSCKSKSRRARKKILREVRDQGNEFDAPKRLVSSKSWCDKGVQTDKGDAFREELNQMIHPLLSPVVERVGSMEKMLNESDARLKQLETQIQEKDDEIHVLREKYERGLQRHRLSKLHCITLAGALRGLYRQHPYLQEDDDDDAFETLCKYAPDTTSDNSGALLSMRVRNQMIVCIPPLMIMTCATKAFQCAMSATTECQHPVCDIICAIVA